MCEWIVGFALLLAFLVFVVGPIIEAYEQRENEKRELAEQAERAERERRGRDQPERVEVITSSRGEALKRKRAAAEWQREQAELVERMKAEKAEREKGEREELQRLRRIPTSSTNKILGRTILRQIRMISVDNHTSQEAAERHFLSEVENAGANAVINMVVRRHHGGYLSIQGDAVLTK